MQEKTIYQEFVEFVAKNIVRNPDAVRTEQITDDRGVLVTLHVAQEDLGFMLGKQGSTAVAFRKILRGVGGKHNEPVSLRIHDPERD